MSGRYDRPLTPEQIAAVKDESIDFSDIPELDEGFWERAELVEPDRTDQITMRVKRSVLAYFKAPGKGYQTRINRVLESYVRYRTGESADTGRARGADKGSVLWYRSLFSDRNTGGGQDLGDVEFLHDRGLVVECGDRLAPTRRSNALGRRSPARYPWGGCLSVPSSLQ